MTFQYAADDAETGFLTRYALTCGYLRGRFDIPKILGPTDELGKYESDIWEARDAIRITELGDPSKSSDLSALLAKLFKFTVGYLRWEPRNPSRLHSAIPRPGGGAFCTRIYLSASDGQGHCRHWCYDPNSESLYVVGETGDDGAGLVISVVADVSRIANAYGDFALTLAMLEGGHCSAQLAMLLGALDEPFDWAEGTPLALPIDHQMQIGIGQFRLERDDAAEILSDQPTRPTTVGTPIAPEYFTGRHAVMLRAARSVARPTKNAAKAAIIVKPSQIDLAQLEQAALDRSSGLQGEGFVPRPVLDEAGFHVMLTNWRRMSECVRTDRHLPIRMRMALMQVEGVAPQLAEYDLPSGELRQLSDQSPAMALRRHVGLGAGYNFDLFTCVLIMTCPVNERILRDGPGGYRALLAEAGALGQTYCMASTAAGLFARPFRAYSEAALETYFGFEDQMVYMILCGGNRIINPAFPL